MNPLNIFFTLWHKKPDSFGKKNKSKCKLSNSFQSEALNTLLLLPVPKGRNQRRTSHYNRYDGTIIWYNITMKCYVFFTRKFCLHILSNEFTELKKYTVDFLSTNKKHPGKLCEKMTKYGESCGKCEIIRNYAEKCAPHNPPRGAHSWREAMGWGGG